MKSILEFRESVEGASARMLAQRHSAGHILRLRMYIDAFRRAAVLGAGDEELAEALFQYHRYIALSSGNTVLPMVHNAFHDVGVAFWRMWIRQTGAENAAAFLEGFTACIAGGDGEGAMRLYREGAERFLREAFPATAEV